MKNKNDKEKSFKDFIPLLAGRELILFLVDSIVIAIAYFSAILISRFEYFNWISFFSSLKGLPILIATNCLVCIALKSYKVIWRYATVKSYVSLGIACAVGNLIFTVVDMVWLNMFDFTYYFVCFMLTVIGLLSVRVIYILIFNKASITISNIEKQRTLVVGAGSAAKVILEEIMRPNSLYKPICIVDDDEKKQQRNHCDTIPVVGTTLQIDTIVKKFDIQTIIFAIPSAEDRERKRILDACVETGCKLRVLPNISNIIEKTSYVKQIHDIKIEDLLCRKAVEFDCNNVKSYITKKTVLVSGGGGSIGSELCRQVAMFEPEKLIILDVYENSAYDIQQELKMKLKGKLFVEIVNITDYSKMKKIYEEYTPDIVFHAAAHKHVPLMETNPEEAVKNNVFGTYNIASLAKEFKVKKFIMVSTDKAVNPTNIMGATKRCCEMIVQLMASQTSDTEFAAVRFGNVLGSNGSVIPLFRKQIENGGPVTITDKRITRFFMSIPEAVSLILQAGAFAKGGEIFVLDMSEPVKIYDLAKKLIRIMGYIPDKDIMINEIGLRPGEKLYEEVLNTCEGKQTTNEKIIIGQQTEINFIELQKQLKELRLLCETNDKAKIRSKMKEIIPTFKEPSEVNCKAEEDGKLNHRNIK